VHAKRITVQPRDLTLARRMRGEPGKRVKVKGLEAGLITTLSVSKTCPLPIRTGKTQRQGKGQKRARERKKKEWQRQRRPRRQSRRR
jgi:hypothetical protein